MGGQYPLLPPPLATWLPRAHLRTTAHISVRCHLSTSQVNFVFPPTSLFDSQPTSRFPDAQSLEEGKIREELPGGYPLHRLQGYQCRIYAPDVEREGGISKMQVYFSIHQRRFDVVKKGLDKAKKSTRIFFIRTVKFLSSLRYS